MLIVVLLVGISVLAGNADEPVWPPLSYIIRYSAPTGDAAFVDQMRQAPPDLLHVGATNEPIMYGGEGYEWELTREHWLPIIDQTRDWVRELHAAGCKWIIPYICNMSIGGDHEQRLGFWRLWDHWDEYGYPELGFGPQPPDDPIEWTMRNPNGDFWFFYPYDQYAPGHRYAMCPNNPYWRDWLVNITRWNAKVGYDGVFVDNGNMHCYCKHCQAKFKDYIRERYTEAELPEQLGVNSFDEVEMGTEGPLLAEVYRFWAVSEAEHYAAIKQAGEEFKPGFLVMPNALGNSIGNVTRGSDPYIWRNSVDAVMAEGCKPPELVATPLSGESTGVAFRDNILPYKLIAGLPGRKLCTPMQYKMNYSNPQQIGLTMAEAAAFGAVFVMARPSANTGPWNDRRQFLNAHRALYENVEPIAPVALLLSFNDLRAGNSAALSEVGEIRKALQDEDVPYVLLEVEAIPDTDLGQFDVVIAPNVTCFGDSEASALIRYVRRGGKLIVTGAAGSRYWAGAERPVSALAKILPATPGRLAMRKVGSGLCIWNFGPLAGRHGPVIAQALFKVLGRCLTYLRPSAIRRVCLDTWQRDDGARLVHLVNYNLDPVTDLELLLPWPARKRSVKVLQYVPGQPPVALTPTLLADGMVVKVDKLERYAVLLVSGLSTRAKGTGSITQFLPQTREEVARWAAGVAQIQLVYTIPPPPLQLVAPQASTTPDQALSFLRYRGTYLIAAQAGEELDFTVHSRLRSGTSEVRVLLFDPQDALLLDKHIRARGSEQFTVVAPTTGTYMLEMTAGGDACGVEIANRYAALPVDQPVDFFCQPAQLYFWVPQDAKVFMLSADAMDLGAEGAKISVLRPDGTLAGKLEGALDLIERMEIVVPPDAAGAVWSLKAEAPEGMILEDFRVQLSGDCVPLLSDAPGRVVRPAGPASRHK